MSPEAAGKRPCRAEVIRRTALVEELLLGGKAEWEISAETGLAERTVRTYLRKIAMRWDAAGSEQVARPARREEYRRRVLRAIRLAEEAHHWASVARLLEVLGKVDGVLRDGPEVQVGVVVGGGSPVGRSEEVDVETLVAQAKADLAAIERAQTWHRTIDAEIVPALPEPGDDEPKGPLH